MDTQTDAAKTIEAYEQEIVYLKERILELEAQVNWFMEQFKLARHERFGSSSEKTDVPKEQPSLFNEAEKEANLDTPEPILETVTFKRRKQKGCREAMLKDLPVETIEHDLPPEEQTCPNCGGALHKMSEVVREELKYIPAQLKLIRHVSNVYACRQCERKGTETPIITAESPHPVISKSFASPSLVASVMNAKYVDGLPLNRQEKQWKHLGFDISRQTMANWVIRASNDWLEPLYQRLHNELLNRKVLCADETSLQVLHETGRKAQSKSFMWLYRTGRDGPPIVLFDYKETRAGKHPKKFLSGFKGYLQVDGYPGYSMIPGVTLVGCWAHARRKFDEALKVLPVEKRLVPGTAREGLEFCNKLFEVEREISDASPEERYNIRLNKSRPILDEFALWLFEQSHRVLPNGLLGKAVSYCLNQWHKLDKFLLDGKLEIHNNRSEGSIRPFVVGRKGWLFCNTPRGARASAVVYSIVETAKENGLVPFKYLEYLFEKMPNLDTDAFDELLPWSPTIPDYCRLSSKSN